MDCGEGLQHGLDALRHALIRILAEDAVPAGAAGGPLSSRPLSGSTGRSPGSSHWLATEAVDYSSRPGAGGPKNSGHSDNSDDSDLAVSSAEDTATATRLIALVDLAREGDKEAFGQLYDHYQTSVYRFIYYRVGSVTLAEDLASETFFRALRSMSSFRWQGKDFGAWLMTIARNLTADHFKAGRTRLEQTTEDMGTLDSESEGPEVSVLASLTNEVLLKAMGRLPAEQQECLIMRFLQGLSIAETAAVLGRSSGAVKQLQLRGVRNLAKLLPEGVR